MDIYEEIYIKNKELFDKDMNSYAKKYIEILKNVKEDTIIEHSNH